MASFPKKNPFSLCKPPIIIQLWNSILSDLTHFSINSPTNFSNFPSTHLLFFCSPIHFSSNFSSPYVGSIFISPLPERSFLPTPICFFLFSSGQKAIKCEVCHGVAWWKIYDEEREKWQNTRTQYHFFLQKFFQKKFFLTGKIFRIIEKIWIC